MFRDDFYHRYETSCQSLSSIGLTNSTCLIPSFGFQSFLRVLTQISPLLATLGWNIFVMKKPLGGSAGNDFPRTSFIWKEPPAKGVPAKINPIIQPIHKWSVENPIMSVYKNVLQYKEKRKKKYHQSYIYKYCMTRRLWFISILTKFCLCHCHKNVTS